MIWSICQNYVVSLPYRPITYKCYSVILFIKIKSSEFFKIRPHTVLFFWPQMNLTVASGSY